MNTHSTSWKLFVAPLLAATIINTYVPATHATGLPAVNCADLNRLLNLHSTTWDVALGFSISCNPIGSWSYGSTPTLGGAFTRFTRTGTLTFQVVNGAVGQWVGTYSQGGQFFPIVSKFYGDPGSTVSVVVGTAGQDDQTEQERPIIQSPANGIVMHPTLPGLGYGVIRWTAPQTRTYVITVSFFSAEHDRAIGATTDVHVQRNHVSLFDGNVTGVGSVQNYSTGSRGIALNAGDVIDLAVGPDGDLTADSTGVAAKIEEPAD
jgi:hypothetical protein